MWLLVTGTSLLWGSGGLMSKALIESGVDAFTVTAAPFVAAALVAWLVTPWIASRAAVSTGLALGMVSVSGPALLFNLGYETLPAGVVTLLIALGPVITAVAAHFTFQDERFSPGKGLGLAVSLAGVGVLSLGQGGEGGGAAIGVALVLAGALVSGTTAVWSRSAARRHGARTLVPAQLTGAAIMPTLMAIVLDRDLVPDAGLMAWQLLGLAAIGSLSGFVGFHLIMKANEIGTAGQVSLIGYLIPIVGVGGGALLFDEPITSSVVGGGLLIVVGVLITGRASAKPAGAIRSAG